MRGVLRVGLVVEFRVSEADAPELHAALAEEPAAVEAGEPGCVLFDVLLWNPAGTEGRHRRIDTDVAARDARRASVRLAELKRGTAPLDVRMTKREGRALTR